MVSALLGGVAPSEVYLWAGAVPIHQRSYGWEDQHIIRFLVGVVLGSILWFRLVDYGGNQERLGAMLLAVRTL